MIDISHLPPAEFTAKARQFMAQACPTKEDEPFFNRCMSAAKAMRMTWVQGLQYVVEKRRGLN